MKKTILLAPVLIAVFISLALSTPAAAQDKATKIETNRDWTAYEFVEDGSRVCYVASQPVKEQGDYTKRGDVFAFVTHRPGQKEFGVVSFLAGYPYKKDSEVNVSIGDQSFTLFTLGDRAWAPDAETDRKLLEAMRGGRKMVVKGTSSRGTLTTDTYSLMGVTKSMGLINSKCNAPS